MKESEFMEEGVEQDEDAVDIWHRTGQLSRLQVSTDKYNAWCKPFMNSVIVKLLGKSVNVGFMRLRMEEMWASKGPMRVTPLNNGYFLVSFSSTGDRGYALQEGPWMIADHYLLVQRRRPNLNPWKADNQKRVAVWVRIPDLPHELYNVESIRRIGNMIGKTLKIDRTTTFLEMGGFTRMYVEVDLQKPLLLGFCHFGDERRFVYEGLHLVCFTFGKYGHRMEQCTSQGPSQEPAGSTAKGPLVASAVPETTRKEDVVGGLKGNNHHVSYGPQMLVKRALGKSIIRTDLAATQSDMAKTKAENVTFGVNGIQESGDPGHSVRDQEVKKSRGVDGELWKVGEDIQNKIGNQEWIQVGSKRKVGAKVKIRGKENKVGLKSQAREKGKGGSMVPNIGEQNSRPQQMNGPMENMKGMEFDSAMIAGD
ncbi:hypothetical protein K1719_015980 [Acacia pycnantha]|nr:hypothetical protein K1719_015980 [Acacia pycnantha]